MQTDLNTIDNVTIIDGRDQKSAKPAEAEKPKRTAEQNKLWEEGKDKMSARMYPNAKKDDKKEDKADEKKEVKKDAETNGKAKVETTETKTTEKKEDAPATEKKTALKPVAKKEEAPVDYEKLARTVAQEVVKAKDEKATAKKVVEDDDVPEARRRDLAAVKYLDETNPKYKGKLESYKKFAKEESAYVEKWEKENPGLKFDADSDEHSTFYDKHEPDIDPDDLVDARVEMAAERKARALVEKESGQTRKELDELKLQRELERADQAAPSLLSRNLALVGGAMGEDVAKALSELKDGQTLEETDPAAHVAISSTWAELHPKTLAAARIFGTNGRAYNGEDPVHKEVAKEAVELEQKLLEQDEKKRTTPDGRTYSTLDEWSRMSGDERKKHWTIDADLMCMYLGNKAAEKAEASYKGERERVEKLAKAYGYSKNGAPSTAQTQHREVDETTDDNEKHRSPSTSSRTVIQPGTTAAPKTSKDGGDVMLGRMFRG